jgi:hypothetical protein
MTLGHVPMCRNLALHRLEGTPTSVQPVKPPTGPVPVVTVPPDCGDLPLAANRAADRGSRNAGRQAVTSPAQVVLDGQVGQQPTALGRDGAVRVWRLAGGTPLVPPLEPSESVSCVAVHGNVIVTVVRADIAVHQSALLRPMR